jgi:large subunit ribosomal protein L15
MKLHDLRPAEGARKPRTRVGRGIAAGKGKTAGRGTKGQKSRTGGTIQPWFEGGQTPVHVRIPKLRGFRNAFRIEYEVVNVGRISQLAETGVLDAPEIAGAAESAPGKAKAGKPAPVTVTQEILAAVGLVRSLNRPLKVLGQGDVNRPMFIIADAFSKSATAKIEAAGGTAEKLEYPGAPGSEKGTVQTTEASTEAPARAAKPTKTARAPKAEVAEAPAQAAPPAAEAAEAPAQAAPPAAEAAEAPAQAAPPAAEVAGEAGPSTPDEASGSDTDKDI